MTTTQTKTVGPTDLGYFAEFDTDTLREIVRTKTADSLAMFLNGGIAVSRDAMSIANNAFAELVLRGEEV